MNKCTKVFRKGDMTMSIQTPDSNGGNKVDLFSRLRKFASEQLNNNNNVDRLGNNELYSAWEAADKADGKVDGHATFGNLRAQMQDALNDGG